MPKCLVSRHDNEPPVIWQVVRQIERANRCNVDCVLTSKIMLMADVQPLLTAWQRFFTKLFTILAFELRQINYIRRAMLCVCVCCRIYIVRYYCVVHGLKKKSLPVMLDPFQLARYR